MHQGVYKRKRPWKQRLKEQREREELIRAGKLARDASGGSDSWFSPSQEGDLNAAG